MRVTSFAVLLTAGTLGVCDAAVAQSGCRGEAYRLVADSLLVHQPCPGPPPLISTLSGGFDLSLLTSGLGVDVYEIRFVNWSAESADGSIPISGSGEYRLNRITNAQSIELSLQLGEGPPQTFRSVPAPTLGRPFPAIDIQATSGLIGCREFTLTIRSEPTCPADFNHDGQINPDDLGDYINCYFGETGGGEPCDRADFNCDGNIDPDDLGDFINVYFECS